MPSVITPCGGGGGGGIQFNTFPQDGGWLWVRTTGASPQHSTGIYLRTAAGSNGGIDFENSSSGTFIIENYGDELSIYSNPAAINIDSADGVIVLGEGDLGVNIKAEGDGDIQIHHTGTDGDIQLKAEDGQIRLLEIPTSAPAASGSVWNDGGTLKIT